MYRLISACAAAALVVGVAAPASAQNDAQLEANKRVVMEFLRTTATPQERYAVLHDRYVDFAAPAKKRAEANQMSAKEDFLKGQLATPNPAGAPGSVTPPIITAEGDLVSVVREPRAGNYIVDAFRVRDGKIIERWNSQAIAPPRAQ